jgi:hypothetical protein
MVISAAGKFLYHSQAINPQDDNTIDALGARVAPYPNPA